MPRPLNKSDQYFVLKQIALYIEDDIDFDDEKEENRWERIIATLEAD